MQKRNNFAKNKPSNRTFEKKNIFSSNAIKG